ncbi:hypothetical protein IK146_00335 [Candidatus Saccharibacteria bacterium]|nr:hypothetical protein [Candidatus Saccharibacteria bacterium]
MPKSGTKKTNTSNEIKQRIIIGTIVAIIMLVVDYFVPNIGVRFITYIAYAITAVILVALGYYLVLAAKDLSKDSKKK